MGLLSQPSESANLDIHLWMIRHELRTIRSRLYDCARRAGGEIGRRMGLKIPSS
jgi:hypothetical protein